VKDANGQSLAYGYGRETKADADIADLGAALTVDKSPYQQDDNCTHDGTDETGPLTLLVPADGLSEIGRQEGTDNAKGCGEDEALGPLVAGCDEFGNHSSNEADNDGPENAEHGFPLLQLIIATTRQPAL